MLRATTACTFATSQFLKVVSHCGFLWKCASHHNGVHFFDISTSKSGPIPSCFVHFGNVLRATTACTFSTSQLPKVVRSPRVSYILETFFAPQRRALFRHLNFQKCSEHGFIHFTWKRASRHNGVHFFDISASKSGPIPSCFVHFDLEMCFAPQRRAIFHLCCGQLAPHLPL